MGTGLSWKHRFHVRITSRRDTGLRRFLFFCRFFRLLLVRITSRRDTGLRRNAVISRRDLNVRSQNHFQARYWIATFFLRIECYFYFFVRITSRRDTGLRLRSGRDNPLAITMGQNHFQARYWIATRCSCDNTRLLFPVRQNHFQARYWIATGTLPGPGPRSSTGSQNHFQARYWIATVSQRSIVQWYIDESESLPGEILDCDG